MIKEFSFNVLRFIFLILLQIFVLNNIQLSGFMVPYAYILFILLLPQETKPLLLLILSFAMGLAMDLLSYTPGMHTSACLLLGFVRPFLLNLLMPRDGFPGTMSSTMYRLGFSWFFRYTLMMVLIHHSVLFFLESFEFTHILYTLARIVGSTVFSSGIIFIIGYFFIPRKPV